MTHGKSKNSVQGLSQLNLPLLERALQQVEELNLEICALKEEIVRLKQQGNESTSMVSESEPACQTHNGAIESIACNKSLDELLAGRPPSTKATSVERSSPIANPAGRIQSDLSPVDKIALYRDLFTGRQDVYAVRWQSAATGNSGYQPARKHDFNSHIFDPRKKKKVCSDNCPDLPLTDEVLKHHLQGKHTIGTYALLQDDTCRFLAIDLDEGSWQEDARSLLHSASSLNVPAYLERSRSGNGGHI